MAFYSHALLKPYVVFDVAAGRDAAGAGVGGSRYNLAEVNLALALFQVCAVRLDAHAVRSVLGVQALALARRRRSRNCP